MRWWRDRTAAPGARRAMLLAAVVAVDVALVAASLGRADTPRAVADRLEPAPPAPRISADPAAAPAAPVRSKAARFGPRALSVSQLTARLAVRVKAEGTCVAGGARVQMTTDNGRTWRDLRPPLRMVLRVVWTEPESGWLIGMAGDCRPVYLRTDSAGRQWSVPRPTRGAWHRLLDPAARTLHAPGGTVESPCRPGERLLDLDGMTFTASVALCSGGRVYRTSDGGHRWRAAGRVPGALAASFAGTRAGLAITPGGGTCAGLRAYRTNDQGGSWRPAGCVTGATGPGVGVGLASRRDGLVVAGGRAYSTRDGGATWVRR